jgi:hypothetical protein
MDMQNRTSHLNLNIKGAFQHASSCANQQNMDLVMKLIQKDADHHHLFFNDEGFHNHLVHQLLADYSLGANRPRLEKAYEDNAIFQCPKRLAQSDFLWNSLQCLGNENYYTSYLNFFQEEVQKKGVKRCIEYYIFEQDPKLGLFSRFIAGVYHPIIHLGYGIEFNYPLMVAEGLAWIAVHKPRSNQFFEPIKENKHALQSDSSSTALEIILSVHQDSRLDGIAHWTDDNKYTTVINKASDLLQEYCRQWPVSALLDGKNSLRERATELQILAASMYAGSYRPGDETILDFFLMHTLTSSLFLHCYVELLDPNYAAALLRGKFAADLVWYIAHGRPYLNIEQFITYPDLLDWDQIISKAIASEDDHVPKAIRALIHASHYDKHTLSPEIYQGMASLTVNENLFWSLDAIGFDEARYGNKKKQQAKTRIIHV